MMTEISKPPLNNRQFLIRWIFGHVMSWLVAIVVAIPFFFVGQALEPIFPNILDFLFPIAVGLGVGSVTARVQHENIQRRFGVNLKHWVRWSILAWIFSTLITQMTSNFYPESFTHMAAMQGAILFTIPALVQGWMLRKYLTNAWLYVLASISGAITFSIPVAASADSSFPSIIFGYGIYAAVMGLTVIWMFGMAGYLPQQGEARNTSRLAYTDDDDNDDDDHWHNQNSRKSYLVQG